MSAVIWTSFTTLPDSDMEPVTLVVRPVGVCPPPPTSCSWTRYPTNEAVPSPTVPNEVDTFQVPSSEAGAATAAPAGITGLTVAGGLRPIRVYHRAQPPAPAHAT